MGDLPPCDAIVVLGAPVRPDGTPGPALRRRTLHAIAVWKDVLRRTGQAPRLILSGGVTRGTVSEARVMADMFHAAGVPPDAMLLDEAAARTLENARNALRLARVHGCRRLLLVSDGYHLPRARLAFRLLGLSPCPGSAAPGARHEAPLVWFANLLREAVAIPAYLVVLPVLRLKKAISR